MAQMAAISQQIWDMKYRLKGADARPLDKTVADTWRRIAGAIAAGEKNPAHWEERFYRAMEDFRFLPAGRIVAGAGAGRQVTLFNCFVMGDIPDDMGGIFDALKDAALTMQQGGGIGYDFSTLRPKGARVRGVGSDASGPLPFMDVWDSMCRTIMSAGSRRGAMMGVLRCDHPDIEDFIDAKRAPGRMRMFNLSVLVSDDFIRAIKEDSPWDLVFDGVVYRTVKARDLWDRIMHATYEYAEPGVIFIDRINKANNLWYCETIHATNPCGEQPLPPYGACLLGSVNLAKLVSDPFGDNAHLDVVALREIVGDAVRFLDDVIDVSNFPLPQQRHEALSKRRIGLGVTGLGDALILCGARYGSASGVELCENWFREIERAAYFASVEIAKEKGPFPLFDREKYLQGEKIQGLDVDLRAAIAEHGIRNSHLTSVAPTGTISLYADNVSSGLEPVFSFKYSRHVLQPDGSRRAEEVVDYVYRLFRRLKGEGAPLPEAFVDAMDLTPDDHLLMQGAAQRYVDSSISKTINVPEDISFDSFKDIYMRAFDCGCKGCTTYRPNAVTGAVLEVEKEKKDDLLSEPELPFGPPTRAHANTRPKDMGDSGAIAQLFKPLDRPDALPGETYKVHWPENDHAIYITLNDLIDENGRRRPFEVFINSKNMEHYAWTVALTRMISAVFRRGGDVSFVVEELKAVFDPRGGQWVKGRYVPSLLAAIGEIIEQHMIFTGFLQGSRADGGGHDAAHPSVETPPKGEDKADSRLKICPKCSQPGFIHQEGCDSCLSCGFSKCG